MRKIPTIYLRDERVTCSPVTGDINSIVNWVFEGQGIATRKIDGINVKIENGIAYERIKPLSKDYYKAEYGKVNNEYVKKVVESQNWKDGIYEAYGEGIKNNMENIKGQAMVRILPLDPILILPHIRLNYRFLMNYLSTHDIEGIVWHNRSEPETMAKIKTRDFFHLHRPGKSPLS